MPRVVRRGRPAAATGTLPPRPGSSFVGRSAELAAVDARIAAGGRLVTIAGPPGVGKSRLALEVGHEQASRGRAVRWIDAGDVVQPRALARAVRGGGDVPRSARTPASSGEVSVVSTLEGAGIGMLVIDNLDAASMPIVRWIADLAERWERGCVIVTSRVRLRVPSEAIIDVDPMPIVSPDNPVLDGAAVTLLVDRVRALHSSLVESGASTDAFRAIAALVDGLPVGLEMVALRMRVRRPEDVLVELREPLNVLRASALDSHARFATLGEAYDTAWRSLTPSDRSVLARCAVCAGAFDSDAAAAVVGTAVRSRAALMDALERLVDRSMLRYEAGRGEFQWLETLRAFVRSRPEATKSYDAALARYARHVRFTCVRRSGENPPQTSTALDACFCAWDWYSRTVEDDRIAAYADLALAAAASPDRDPADARVQAMLDEALRAAPTAEVVPPTTLARLRVERAELRALAGDLDGARADVLEACTNADASAERSVQSVAALQRGRWHWLQGHLDDSTRWFKSALEQARTSGDAMSIARAANALGVARQLSGALEDAAALYEEAGRHASAAGDARQRALVDANRGSLAIDRGELDAAQRLLASAQQVLRTRSDRRRFAIVGADLGAIALERGQLDDARRLFSDSVASARRYHARQSEGLYLAYLGCTLEGLGSADEARKTYDAAIVAARESHNQIAEGLALAWSGRLDAERGETVASRRALDEATACFERSQDRVRWEVAYLCRGHLELALARDAEHAEHAEEARALRQHARERAASALEVGSGDPPGASTSLAARSADVRMALRMLEAALPVADEPSRAVSLVPPALSVDVPRGALLVAPDGAWFRAPSGTRVSLRTRGNLRSLMAHLAKQRQEAPGVAADVETLFAAGWPGERAAPQSRASRVYVALSTLRGLGLREILERQHDGYLLSTDVEVAVG